MEIRSTAFKEGASIPIKYTCDGENISPPLSWTEPPEGVKSFALISDDPDAPMSIWVHWVIYNIPPDESELPENIPHKDILTNGCSQGMSDFGKVGYGGPCPPSGSHRYLFRMFALDTVLNLKPRASKKELKKAMKGHILAKCQLMGRYRREF